MQDRENRATGRSFGLPGQSAAAFALLRDLIAQRTGVFYSDSKRELLEDRLTEEIAGLGIPSLFDYYYLLKYDPDSEGAWRALRNRLAVPETFFWRQPEQFEVLAKVLMPRFAAEQRIRPLRIWCAACCTGEEPLSIAIALEEGGWFERLPIEIVASDASVTLLERAQRGIYGERSLRALSPELRNRYFRPQAEGWKISPELHSRVRFTAANLVDAKEIEPLADADVIFCRNVFIYFSDEAIRRVVRVFSERIRAPGYLFLGSAESLMRLSTDFVMDEIGPAFVYLKNGLSGPSPRVNRGL